MTNADMEYDPKETQMQDCNPVEWLTIEALAAELGIPKQTFYRWRTEGKGPRAHKFGRHLRFAHADVEAWINEQAEPGPAAEA